MIEFTQKSAPILVFQKCTPSLPSNFRAFFSALKESICPYLVFLHRWLFSLRKHEPCFLCIAALFSFLELRGCFTVLLIVLGFLSSLCLSLVQWSMWQHRPWWKARVELSVPWRQDWCQECVVVVDGELEASYWPAVSSDNILALFFRQQCNFSAVSPGVQISQKAKRSLTLLFLAKVLLKYFHLYFEYNELQILRT